MVHHLGDIRDHFRLGVIQRDELTVALEGRIVRLAALAGLRPGQTKPLSFARLRTAGDRVLEGREITADMVEHAVEDETQPAALRLLHQRIEIRVVAEAPVDLEMICRIVAVRG